MKYEELPECGFCGRWICRNCGKETGNRNRYFPGKFQCPKCDSEAGHMVPTRHRQSWKKRDHDDTVQAFKKRGYERKY